MEYIWPGIIVGQAIHAAAKLRIPDLLACGPKTIAELASECGAHPLSLERLLRALSTLEMFAPTGDGRFRNTQLTEVLRSDHPQSLRGAAIAFGSGFLWRAFGELSATITTGQPAFNHVFGTSFFEGSSPNRVEVFRVSRLLMLHSPGSGGHPTVRYWGRFWG